MRREAGLDKRGFKDLVYGELARIGKAASSPARLELLELLAQGERPVEALADELGQPIANTSHHLKVLREARLVEARRDGQHIHYRLSDPRVFDLVATIRTLAEQHLAEAFAVVGSYLGRRDDLEPLTRAELVARAKDGTALILDVRPALEYQAGHIPGAISIPIAELRTRLATLPRGREVVAYCRGPYCVFAYQAVELLRAQGRKARRLDQGFPEWRAAGLPVEVAS